MGWFANLPIGRKILSGYFIIFLFSALMGISSVKGLERVREDIDKINQTILQQVVISNDLSVNLTMQNRRVMRHILTPEPEKMEQIRGQLHLNELALRGLLDKYRSTEMDTTETRLFERFTRGLPEYLSISSQITVMSAGGRKQDAMALSEGEGRRKFHELEAALSELVRYNIAEGNHYEKDALELYSSLRYSLIFILAISAAIASGVAYKVTRSITNPIRRMLDMLEMLSGAVTERAALAQAIAEGDLARQVTVTEPLVLSAAEITGDEAGRLLKTVADLSVLQAKQDAAVAHMTESLCSVRDERELRDWLKTGVGGISDVLREDQLLKDLVAKSLSYVCSYLQVPVGALYLWDERDAMLELAAGYGLPESDTRNRRYRLGEGVPGQTALERKLYSCDNVPPCYMTVTSSLGAAEPFEITALPLLHDSRLVGVLEIGAFRRLNQNEQGMLVKFVEVISAGIGVNISRRMVDDLLEQTQAQAEELRVQQEELQQTNEELEERAQILEQQREQLKAKSREVELSNIETQRKAEELARVSSYKSEFLANMSHELRTPLNSLMILSSLLKDNREGNLTDKQMEYAATINSAGKDLLNLINDILDLSKIESGKLEYHLEEVVLSELGDQLKALFSAVAVERGLGFEVSVDDGLPEVVRTDGQRVLQILKNLTSNALKFTRSGGISVKMYAAAAGDSPLNAQSVAFAVTDTGIGIAPEKYELIFQAFRQADGGTSRIYGGTGLGLSISRQLALGLGGDITLASQVGSGSCFTLYLPLEGVEPLEREGPIIVSPQSRPVPLSAISGSGSALPPVLVPDDRDYLTPSGRCILIVEDDQVFARVLAETVRARGFKALVAGSGEGGLALADRFLPSAIMLDVMLPGMDGWEVIQQLKSNTRTRHIPVHFITCLEDRSRAMALGAVGFNTKPVSTEGLEAICRAIENTIRLSEKNLLIIEDDANEAESLVALLSEQGVNISIARSGEDALRLVEQAPFDCIVLDLGLSDMSGFELLETLHSKESTCRVPVVVHSGRDLSRTEEGLLRHYAESIIVKGGKSSERLLNEVSIFLHLVENGIKQPEREAMVREALNGDSALAGKKVLLVDDDMRNIFSLSSVLSEKGLVVVEAENGREALACLEEHPDIDLVLMDVMMPVMDGLAATRAIRENPRLRNLPVITLTAKAMKGDREECIRAGASDYISKPVDVAKLLSLLRVWLYGKSQG